MDSDVMTRKNNRNSEIELIRVLSAYFVVAIHVFTRYRWKNGVISGKVFFLESFTRICVPCFFMITGYFIFNKKKPFKKVIKSLILGIVIPSFIAMVFYQVFYDFIQDRRSFIQCLININIDYRNLFGNIFKWKAKMKYGYHFWYIFELIEIYLWYPILTIICTPTKKMEKIRRYLIILCFFSNSVLPTIREVSGNKLGLTFNSPIDIYLMYVMIGYEIKLLHERAMIGKMAIDKYIYSCIYILGSLITFATIYFFADTEKISKKLLDYNSLGVVIGSVAFFLLLLSIKIKNEKAMVIINYLGSKTFYVYLVHIFVIKKLNYLGFASMLKETLPIGFYFIYITICFILAFMLAIIIEKAVNFLYAIIKKMVDYIQLLVDKKPFIHGKPIEV